MADLPISSLPLAPVTGPLDPLAVVVSGTTSRATVTTLLTTFTASSTKSDLTLTDQLMIYDGTLLKTTVLSILTTFIDTSLKSNLDLTDQLMIYDSGSLSLLKTTVLDILESFIESTEKLVPVLSDQIMIYDTTVKYTYITNLLNSFTLSSYDSIPDITDELMLSDGSIKRTNINDFLTSFNQNSVKSLLSGDEQVMIWDPSTSSLLKTTIDEITGSIISPTHYVYYGIETSSEQDTYRVRTLGNTDNFDFTFSFPSDLTSITNVYLICSPVGFSGSGNSITFNSSYGNADTGESITAVTGTSTFNIDFPVSDAFTKIDVTNLFTTGSGASRNAAAGDMAGLLVDHNAISGSVNYFMLELIYEGPGGSGSTIIIIDNLTSTSTVDALSANQGRVLNEIKQDISTLQTDIEALNFDLLTVVDPPVNITDVTNKAYVDSVANPITVVDNLTSTSAVDALSANQGRVLNISKQDIATLQSDIEALNFNTLTVVDSPVASTDAANKAYVDANVTPITVIDNLNSTSATDALSANQGRVLNITKQDISTLQADIEAINFNILKSLDAPINSVDLANKAYVDSVANSITVIDNLTSTSATDALSANQGRVLNITKQDIDTLQDDIEALNFASLTVTTFPVTATDVANKSYVDSSSGGIVVIDNLTSTSATDALSANQGRILNDNKQEISTLESDIEALSFDSLTVLDVPVNATDVTNKSYVDSVIQVTVIDNLTSTSTTDALSANQGRVLNENKQDSATLQTDIEALNFDSLTVGNTPVNLTDVANKAYVDSSSGGVIVVDNLTSTSTTDALSANQGRVLNEIKQDISTLQTDIEALSFTSLTVTDSPVNNTDVSNKFYVDQSIDPVSADTLIFLPSPNAVFNHIGTPSSTNYSGYSSNIAYFTFMIPQDYVSLYTAEICYYPQATDLTTQSITWGITGARNSPATSNTNTGSINYVPGTHGNVEVVDITSILNSISLIPGQYIGLVLAPSTVASTFWLLGSLYYSKI